MSKKEDTNIVLYLAISDLLLTLLSLYLAVHLRTELPWGRNLPPHLASVPWGIYLVVALMWGIVFQFFSVYAPSRRTRAIDEVQQIIVAVLTSVVLLAGILYLSYREVSRLLFLYFAAIDLVALVFHRLLLRMFLSYAGGSTSATSRVLIVGMGRVGQELARQLRERSWSGLDVVGCLDDDPEKLGKTFEGVRVLGKIEDVENVVKANGVDEVIITLPAAAHSKIEKLVLKLLGAPVSVRIVPDMLDLAFSRASLEDFGGIPLIGLRDPAITGFQRLVKRTFDLVLSVTLLFLLWPLLLLIAIAIKATSPGGPIIFKQKRVGENGKFFMMYKFRTMVPNAEQMALEKLQQGDREHFEWHKRPDDPRVTPLGRILRHTSLDELPQLFNVIKGEMSLVGPRPELPYIVAHYEPWQYKRFSVPPGITGWWQVNGRSERAMHLHTEDDLYYIQNYSPWLDLVILWRTIGAVIKGRGAY
jgi:exopolysaccharide biosynthesis polyprenyl glycosylphosphotransferase